MNIIIAKEIGYCYGVKDAFDKVIEVAKNLKTEVHTFGPLIHNPSAVRELTSKYNISVIDNINELKSNTMAIRAHGISPKMYNSFESKGINIIDTTCPFVKRTQKLVKNLAHDGYFVIILGKKQHPEVVGIAGQIEEQCLAVENEGDLKPLTKKKKIAVVFQSTIILEDVAHLFPIIIDFAKEVKICKTICGVTIKRQSEAKAISKQVDLMIVIGSKNSSNTTKLYIICRNQGVKTIQIEKPNEIQNIDFSNIMSIGITTGTSTPKNIIDDIIKEINKKSLGNVFSGRVTSGAINEN